MSEDKKKTYLLREFAEFDYSKEVAEDGKPKKSQYGNMMVKGILQRANTLNQNGRVYPRNVLEREVDNYQKLIRERRATGECVDEQTEILTKSGWKFIKDISENENIFTLNPNTNVIETHQIEEKVVLPFIGQMLSFTNGKKLDMLVTPGHKMVFWDRHGKYYKKSASMVAEEQKTGKFKESHSFIKNTGIWIGNTPETFNIPGTSFEMSTNVWANLFGFWLAEGWASKTKPTKLDSKYKQRKVYKVGLTQKKPENIETIDALLAETKMPWKRTVKKCGTVTWIISDKALHAYFFQFGNSSTKFIPRDFFEWNKETLSGMFDWMLLGDGRNRKDKKTGRLIKEYSTISKSLAENVTELMFKLGYGPFIKEHIPQEDFLIEGRIVKKENCQKIYTVAANTTSTSFDKRFTKIKEVDYVGNVYCVRVENNNWLMRRNGKVAWTGNCDHADEPVVNLKNVSHVITEIWWEGDVVWGRIEILEAMDQGRQVAALINNGIKVGISSRAVGSVKQQHDRAIVQDDLQLICWDFVSEPSTPGSFMMREARELNKEEISKILNKSDRIDRIANEILGIKKL